MKTEDLNKPLNSTQLNENMFKKFGVKINFDKYNREELENYRNLLRTKVSQVETKSNFNDLLTDESYQKDKYMMGMLTQRIKEIVGEGKKVDRMVQHIKKSEKKAGKSDKDAEDIAWATANKRGMLDNKNKKKKTTEGSEMKKTTNESAESKARLAHKHATLYQQAHKQGDLEEALHHKQQCEECGGMISHGAMGECWHTHIKLNKGKPYQVGEGMVGGALGGIAGAALGGPMGAMTGYAAGSKAGDDLSVKESAMAEGKKPKWLEKAEVKAELKQSQKVSPKEKKKVGVQQEGWDDMMKAVKDKKDSEGTGKFDKKKTSTGTQYTRKSSTFTDGGDDSDVKKAKKKATKESQFRINARIVNEGLRRLILEDEEGKAKAITAGTDMVNDFTSWMQRVGQYQTKSMIELADAIKANFGPQEAEQFKQMVQQALETSLQALTQTREEISNAVAVLAGEAPAATPMGNPPMDDAEVPGMEEPGAEMGGDEFGASDAAAGGMETSGREMRESRKLFARKLAESHNIMRSLSK